MQLKRVLGAGVVLAALLLAGLWLYRDKPSESPPESIGDHGPKGTNRGSPEAAPHNAATYSRREKPGSTRSRLTAESRRALLAKLAEARNERLARTATPGARPSLEDGKEIAPLTLANKTGSNTEWEKRQLDTLNQLLAECYDLASSEQPDLAGTLGVQFTISGEPEIGGLVDDIEIMEGYSTIDQPSMRECVTESLYALELDPPPEGVSVGRQVTLRFEPD